MLTHERLFSSGRFSFVNYLLTLMKKIQRLAVLSLSSALALLTLLSFNSCATLNSLAGLTRAQFKLNDAVGYRLSGIDVMNKHSISDFSIMDGLNIVTSFCTASFPLTFTRYVSVKNANAY